MFKMDMCNCLKIKSTQILKNLTSRKFLATLFLFMMILTGAQAATLTNPTNSDSWNSGDTIILNNDNTIELSTNPTITEFDVTGQNNILD